MTDIAKIAAGPLKLVLDWIEEVLEATDPENPDSHYCDHPRECAEGIAFDTRRDAIRAAIAHLKEPTP